MLSGINLNLSRSCLEGVKLTNANLGVAYLGKSLELDSPVFRLRRDA
jgi:hypothetical protein